MPEKTIRNRNIYDIMENDKGEIMVLLYAGDTEPAKPSFSLLEQERTLELYRNPTDFVAIRGLQDETIEKFKSIKSIYICEMKYNEDPETEGEIAYAYIANLKKKESEEQQETQSQQDHSSELQKRKQQLSEKIQKSREKLSQKNAK